jgi:hypothetical protein
VSKGARRHRTIRIVLVTAAAATFVAGAGGCSRSRQDTVYCVDESNRVVPDTHCDDDYRRGGYGGYYYWHNTGRYNYPPGTIVSGGQRVRTTDSDGRARLGMSRSGTVGSGTVSRGGIGKGSSTSNGSAGKSSGG